ncbi:DsbA family protein [Deinococcus malanensis]|uniref:DsbA family protein n=1 Tax=Deinococcus malanensis TaxID=1706855 RepID=UPI0036330745
MTAPAPPASLFIPTAPAQLRVDVWSDIACPWCHIGKRRLEAALERFPQRDAVQVVWHSFELDPPRRSSSLRVCPSIWPANTAAASRRPRA